MKIVVMSKDEMRHRYERILEYAKTNSVKFADAKMMGVIYLSCAGLLNDISIEEMSELTREFIGEVDKISLKGNKS